jgi:hypothetical protein
MKDAVSMEFTKSTLFILLLLTLFLWGLSAYAQEKPESWKNPFPQFFESCPKDRSGLRDRLAELVSFSGRFDSVGDSVRVDILYAQLDKKLLSSLENEQSAENVADVPKKIPPKPQYPAWLTVYLEHLAPGRIPFDHAVIADASRPCWAIFNEISESLQPGWIDDRVGPGDDQRPAHLKRTAEWRSCIQSGYRSMPPELESVAKCVESVK